MKRLVGVRPNGDLLKHPLQGDSFEELCSERLMGLFDVVPEDVTWSVEDEAA